MNYTTVEELLLSDGFLKWYLQTDEKEVLAWDEWIAKNPEHSAWQMKLFKCFCFSGRYTKTK